MTGASVRGVIPSSGSTWSACVSSVSVEEAEVERRKAKPAPPASKDLLPQLNMASKKWDRRKTLSTE